jgi:hypothetical protein
MLILLAGRYVMDADYHILRIFYRYANADRQTLLNVRVYSQSNKYVSCLLYRN